jgi:hypothetical protein
MVFGLFYSPNAKLAGVLSLKSMIWASNDLNSRMIAPLLAFLTLSATTKT